MITVIKEPKRFSPASNPVVFTLSSNSTNFVLFKLQITEAITGNIIYQGNSFPSPSNPTTASINISAKLAPYIKYDVDNNITPLALGKTKPIIGYILTATEYGIAGGVMTSLGVTYTSTIFYVYDGELDIINFENLLTDNSHVLTSGSIAKFLTLQPNYKLVNSYSEEQLYFLSGSYTSLKAAFTVGETVYKFPITGTSIPHTTTTAAVAEVRATATITVTSTGALYDNVGVYDGTHLLGTYTIPSSTISTSYLASAIASTLSSNTYGYSVNYTSGSSFNITMPVGRGASGNGVTLTSALMVPTTTVTNPPTGSPGVASITGVVMPSALSTVYINVVDPTYSHISLAVYYNTGDLSSTSAYIADLVTQINTNSYGYTATQTGSSSFSITSRSGLGTSINGVTVSYIYNNTPTSTTTLTGTFSGGTYIAGGTTTTTNYIIPLTITSFSGGVNSVPASTVTTYTTSLEKMVRIQTSPKALLANGISHSFDVGEQYSVVITDSSDVILSEPKTYTYYELDCNVEAVNIFWVNSFGGIDTYQFLNPQESINTTRLSVQKNNMKLNNTNVYSANGIYNVENETYNSVSKSTIKVYSNELSNLESAWLADLVNSRQCWIELYNSKLVPVQLVSTTYNIQKSQYLTDQLNQYQFEFSFDNGYLPGLSSTTNSSIIINK